MKILAISHSALIESYQEKYDYLANKLGHDVLLITQKKRSEGGGRIVKARDRQSGRLFVKTLPTFFTNSLRRHIYIGLTGYARGFKPDLVYIENEPQSEATGQALGVAAKFNAKLAFFTWENIPQKYQGRKRYIEKRVLAESDAAISGNRDGKNILEKNGFNRPIAIIPQYGINPNLFKPLDSSSLSRDLQLDQKFVIGYVGRLLPEKNIASIIQALRRLPENCVLLIIGSGSEKKTLKNMAAEIGLAERVKFISALKYKEIPLYMNLFDVLVLPSITTAGWKEQFGRVLPEAMACQTPVIGSDSGEIPNVIGKSGLIFPEGNINDLAESLRKLITDKAFYNQLAKSGFERATTLYTNKGIAEQMHAFFISLKDETSTENRR